MFQNKIEEINFLHPYRASKRNFPKYFNKKYKNV